MWLVVGLLAVQVARGSDTHADDGTLRAIADKPFGEVLLVVLAVGFVGYASWRLLEGAFGHRDENEEPKRWAKRLASLFRGGIYLFLAGSVVRFLMSGGGNDKTKPMTARVMSHTGGRTLVFAVGAGLVIGGLAMAFRGIKQKFEKLIEGWKMPDWLRSVTKVVGTAGLVGRGFVFALIGGFLIDAAYRFDPDKAKGLDASLKTLAGQPFGTVLLFASALGLLRTSGVVVHRGSVPQALGSRLVTWDPELAELAHRRKLAARLGGKERVARQHASGRLTVRQRIDRLVDQGTWREVGSVAGTATYDEGVLADLTPANLVTGAARVDGRRVVRDRDNFTVRGGAVPTPGSSPSRWTPSGARWPSGCRWCGCSTAPVAAAV